MRNYSKAFGDDGSAKCFPMQLMSDEKMAERFDKMIKDMIDDKENAYVVFTCSTITCGLFRTYVKYGLLDIPQLKFYEHHFSEIADTEYERPLFKRIL